MRFNLYRSVVIGQDGKKTLHTVAASAAVASEIIKDFYKARGVRLTRSETWRIDEELGPRRQKGLDAMLENAPSGLAEYFPKVGWLVYEQVRPLLHLYEIEERTGETTYVVAPNADIASAIWSLTLDLGEGEKRPYKITESAAELPEAAQNELQSVLQNGPIGIFDWDDEDGWSKV